MTLMLVRVHRVIRILVHLMITSIIALLILLGPMGSTVSDVLFSFWTCGKARLLGAPQPYLAVYAISKFIYPFSHHINFIALSQPSQYLQAVKESWNRFQRQEAWRSTIIIHAEDRGRVGDKSYDLKDCIYDSNPMLNNYIFWHSVNVTGHKHVTWKPKKSSLSGNTNPHPWHCLTSLTHHTFLLHHYPRPWQINQLTTQLLEHISSHQTLTI